MGKLARTFLFVAGLLVVLVTAAKFFLNEWNQFLLIPALIAALLVVAALVMEMKTVLSFLTMRTTKHGMNMGLLIIVALVGMIAVNYIAVSNDKKWDWTSEGLNSLSDQSKKVAQSLKEDVTLLMIYNKDNETENVRRNAQQTVDLYRTETNRLSLRPVNARVEPALAQKYMFSGPYMMVVERGDKWVKVEGNGEEGLTKALIKLNRATKQTIYFTTGHGERSLDAKDGNGLSGQGEGAGLKEDLETLYAVKSLNLTEQATVPEDAAVVAIVGPNTEFLGPELTALRNYARRGGRLFIAIDPGQKHGLANLTKTFGVEFKNEFVLDPAASVPGAGPIAAVGVDLSKTNDATKNLPAGSMTVFLLSSPLRKAPDAPADFQFDELIKTGSRAVASEGLAENSRIIGQGPLLIGMAVKGKLPALGGASKSEPLSAEAKAAAKLAEKVAAQDENLKAVQEESKKVEATEGKEFQVVIFGDSDFLTNNLFTKMLNRDLAINTFASLANDNEMISIRPKLPKGTGLTATRQKILLMLIVLGVMPLLFLLSGSIIWWRRRAA